jgi:Uma2 family endonuclease
METIAILERDKKFIRTIKPTQSEIFYPESDGRPLGETDFHITAILTLLEALRHFFRRSLDVYVAANMMFYYKEGDPTRVKSPDVFVVKRVGKQMRRIFKLWQEQTPCTIFEITSRKTRKEDIGAKFDLYESMGVNEYILFDPIDEYLHPRLQGFRLEHGLYQPMKLESDGSLYSRELGAILRPEEWMLRVIDAVTGEEVPTLEESIELGAEAIDQAEHARRLARAEAERAQAEAERADTAEAETARLRTELERLRRQLTEK